MSELGLAVNTDRGNDCIIYKPRAKPPALEEDKSDELGIADVVEMKELALRISSSFSKKAFELVERPEFFFIIDHMKSDNSIDFKFCSDER